jgi:hypothetical protein
VVSLSPAGRGIGGLWPPYFTQRTPMRSIGYGEGVRKLQNQTLSSDPLPPLFLLMFSGLYMFVLPYAAKRRGQ